MSVKANIVANYVGQGWRTLMSLALVPLYISYLGMEAYGIIALLVTFQAWLSLLDLGLRPVLSREMARFSGGARSSQGVADLLRTMEILAVGVAVSFFVLIYSTSGWLATEWVHVERLSSDTVAQAFTLMGLLAGLQFIESLYTSA
jgi:O-antigen/teichoic acid export membrane protein